jgi:hypothetical protein
MHRRRLAWVLAGLLVLTSAARGEPRLRAQLNQTQLAVADQAVLTVTLEGFSQRAGSPQIPPSADFDVYDSGRSTNISLINGKLTSSTSYTYVFVPHRAGTFTLGPITVEDKGTSYACEPITVTVTAGGGGAAGGAPPGPGAPSRAPSEREAAAAQGQGLFVRLEADRKEACLDEQITVRFRLYQRDDVTLTDLSDFQPPSSEGFWREDLGPQQDYTVEMQGHTYRVREIRWALFPTRAGDLEIGPAGVVAYIAGRGRPRGFFDGFFGSSVFDRRPMPLRTDPLRIRVRPLPDQGRPDGFTGSVGDYQLDAHFDVAQARRGEPFTLTVKVVGTGHIQTIGTPVWPDWDGLRVYDSGEAVSVEKPQDRIAGEKTFTQVLIASRAGRVRLDPVRFVFFDPAQHRYQTVATPPLGIEVVEGGPSPGASGGDLVEVGQDLLYIHTDVASTLRRSTAGRSSAAWLVHAIPLALVGGAAWWRRRRSAIDSDPSFARRSQAYRTARRALAKVDPAVAPARAAGEASELLERYLSDWLDHPVRGTTRGELRGALLERVLPELLIERVTGLLERSEEIRFGAAGEKGEVARLVQDAEALLRDLEAAFRRAPMGAPR